MTRQDPLRVDELFREQVERTPHAIALFDPAGSITFAELEARSDQVAGALTSDGLRDGGFVGLHMERSIDWVISVLAILKSNAAVVPLPPSYPRDRLRDILSHAKLDVVIDDASTALDPTLGARTIHFSDCLAHPGAPRRSSPGPADQPAFVLCSSGSTGKPKMIVRSHQSFMHRLEWTWENHPYATGEVCCQKAHMTTTHAIYELFEPLLRGIPVWIIPDQEARNLGQFWATIRARAISRLLIVPSVLQASLDMPGFVAPPIKILSLMGEHVTPRLAARALEFFPEPTRVFSIYGSTEASSTFVCDLRESLRPEEELPLGQPISSDVRAYVLRETLEAVAAGETGMLHIGGSPVFAEYFNDPALTASAFVAGHGDEKLYKTQDHVTVMADGALRFVGRMDHTVKVRGFRVDLREVEKAILLHDAVSQCAVILNDRDPANPMVVAFVTPAAVSPASVYEAARARLPSYMIPSAVVGLDALPLTASGKVDRRKLLDDYSTFAPERATGQFQSETQRRVAEVWQGIVGRGTLRPDSNFFEVGGTSLSVFVAAHRLREAFKLDRHQLSDLTIYQFPTIEGLASLIDGGHRRSALPATPANAVLVSLRAGSDSSLPPLFVIPSAGGTLGAYEKVAKAMRHRRDVIGVRDPFNWGERDPTLGFRHWVSVYVEAIQQRQPRGPYHVMAYSSAGAFGYEIAQRLRAAGEPVALLVLVDTLGMDRATKWRYGYWAMRARFMRRSFARIIRLGGWLRMAVPRWARGWHTSKNWTLSREAVAAVATAVTTDKDHVLAMSALLELNTGLPFALAPSDLDSAEPSQYVSVLVERVLAVTPEVDPRTIENLLVQYSLQVRAQLQYEIQPYDGKVVLFEVDGPDKGILESQFRPYVRNLSTRVHALGRIPERSQELSRAFAARLRPHFLSMRDEVFVKSLAAALDDLLG